MEFVGLTKLSCVDFDHHIACTLFTQGCNFRCPFCHNSSLATRVDNKEIPFDEILSFLKKRVGILDAVVITGGEPTLMPDLVNKIEAIKELGFLVKLDTNGTHPEVIKELVELKLIDYIAMDVKSSFATYHKITGSNINLNIIKESIDYIMSCGVDYEFRTTIIKEFHTNEDIKEMAKLIEGAKKVRLQLFIDNDNCIEHGLHEIETDQANEFVSILKNHVQDVALRGYKLV